MSIDEDTVEQPPKENEVSKVNIDDDLPKQLPIAEVEFAQEQKLAVEDDLWQGTPQTEEKLTTKETVAEESLILEIPAPHDGFSKEDQQVEKEPFQKSHASTDNLPSEYLATQEVLPADNSVIQGELPKDELNSDISRLDKYLTPTEDVS